MNKDKLNITVTKMKINLIEKKVTAEITVDYFFDVLMNSEDMKKELEKIIYQEITRDLPTIASLQPN